MSLHLHASVVTLSGISANGRGENVGNLSTLQRIIDSVGDERIIISSEAIRFAIRKNLQEFGHPVNRIYDQHTNTTCYSDEEYSPIYIDNRLFGFMDAKAAKKSDAATATEDEPVEESKSKGGNRGKTPKKRGTSTHRKGAIEFSPAISTVPYSGDVSFNATAAAKVLKDGNSNKTSLYSTERLYTSFAYNFSINHTSIENEYKSDLLAVLDAIASLGSVGGNHSRYKFSFVPNAIAMLWTHDPASQIDYQFEPADGDYVSAKKIIRMVKIGDINPQELYVGCKGLVDEDYDELKALGVNAFLGIKQTFTAIKSKIAADLGVDPSIQLTA